MIKTSTHNDIIRFLYGETSPEESGTIKTDMIFNEEARDEYHEISSIKGMLDKTFKTPGERVINNILRYSKSLNLRPVK